MLARISGGLTDEVTANAGRVRSVSRPSEGLPGEPAWFRYACGYSTSADLLLDPTLIRANKHIEG